MYYLPLFNSMSTKTLASTKREGGFWVLFVERAPLGVTARVQFSVLPRTTVPTRTNDLAAFDWSKETADSVVPMGQAWLDCP